MKVKGTVRDITDYDGYQTCTVDTDIWIYEGCFVNSAAKRMLDGDNVFVHSVHVVSIHPCIRAFVADHNAEYRKMGTIPKYLGLPVKLSRFKAFMKWVW